MNGLIRGGPLALSPRQTPSRMFYPGSSEVRSVTVPAVMVGTQMMVQWDLSSAGYYPNAPSWWWANGDCGLYGVSPSFKPPIPPGWNLIPAGAVSGSQFPPLPGIAPLPDEASSLALTEPPQGFLTGGTITPSNPNGELLWYDSAGLAHGYNAEQVSTWHLSALPLGVRISGPEVDPYFSGWSGIQMILHLLAGSSDLSHAGYQVTTVFGDKQWGGTEKSVNAAAPVDVRSDVNDFFYPLPQYDFDNTNIPMTLRLFAGVGNAYPLSSLSLQFSAEYVLYYVATMPGGRPKATARPRSRRVNFDQVAPVAVG